MCGIAGELNFAKRADRELVKAMTRTLTHRGPDGEGFYFSDEVGLGIRRLKIIDLITGDQPIHNEDSSVWVVFNGEIYNYRLLRERLEARGHRFYTRSDTEVIVHLYEDSGEEFVGQLEGMFALALWDAKKKKLLLARDRVGEKPLYYRWNGRRLLFASELKSLLNSPEIVKRIDWEALHYFMVYGRVPSPLSIIEGVKKLPPATLAVVDEGGLTLTRYWSLSFRDKLALTQEEIEEELLALLQTAVKRMLVADVPLGALLSGGVDSSAVVALMAQNSSAPVETFSVGFGGKNEDFSELHWARLVAERYQTRHHEFIIEPAVLELLPRLVRHLDEPFADASIVPTFYIAQAARKHVTVALTGDGGDELFAGYEWFRAIKIAQRYNRLPLFIRHTLASIADFLPDTDQREGLARYLHKFRRLLQTQKSATSDPLDIFGSMTSGFTEQELRTELYAPMLDAQTARFDARRLREETIADYDGEDPLEALMVSQFHSLLPDMFFTKVDRASMAVSLETRSPFAHHPLVEFAARIPFALKLKGYRTKYILKRALRGLLPEAVLRRPKKGFTLPLNRWLREPAFRDRVRDILLDPGFTAEGFFRAQYVETLLEHHTTGREQNGAKIWQLMMFALWRQIVLKT